jgi:hypothetical protein
MTQELLISVDNYVTDLFIPVDPASQEAIAFSENSGASVHKSCALRRQAAHLAGSNLPSLQSASRA